MPNTAVVPVTHQSYLWLEQNTSMIRRTPVLYYIIIYYTVFFLSTIILASNGSQTLPRRPWIGLFAPFPRWSGKVESRRHRIWAALKGQADLLCWERRLE